MTKETPFRVLRQGDVMMAHDVGYMLAGGADAVCFYIDPVGRAWVEASSESDSGCPVVYLANNDSDSGVSTEIEFVGFPGWRFHAGGAGKSIAIALVRRGADE